MDKSFHAQKKCFSTASHPDEALPVFALFLTAGVAASQRRAGRARRWFELATRQVHDRPSWQQLWERAFYNHIMNHHELPRGIRLQRPAWWRPSETINRLLTHEELAHIKTLVPPRPPHPLRTLVTSPAAVGRSAARSRSTPSPATGSSMLGQWRRKRPWDMQRCEVQRLCLGMFDGINQNTPCRWERSMARAETRGRLCCHPLT